jgi:hypothetical protein
VTGKVAPRFFQNGADSHSRRRHRSSRPAHDVRWSRSAAAAESGPQRHSRMATMLQRRAVDGRWQIVVSTFARRVIFFSLPVIGTSLRPHRRTVQVPSTLPRFNPSP